MENWIIGLVVGTIVLVVLGLVGLAIAPLLLGPGAFGGVLVLLTILPALLPLLIPIAVVVLVVVLVLGDHDGTPSSTGPSPSDTSTTPFGPDPLEVLKRRYAEGAIDVDEYERRLELLLGVDSPEAARERLDRLQAEQVVRSSNDQDAPFATSVSTRDSRTSTTIRSDTVVTSGAPSATDGREATDPESEAAAPTADDASVTPIERLRHRLAEGELTVEQFERKRELLEETATGDRS